MDDDRPEWAIQLQDERETQGWSKWEMARRLYRAAGIEGGNVRNLARQISWWEKGKHFPETWASAYCKALGLPEEVLFQGASAWQMTRRGALALAGAAVLTQRIASGPVDPNLVDYFRLQLAGHYGADMMLGPRALIGTVTAQADLIGELLERADSPTRQKLAEVGTAYGQFLGWLHLDAGDARGATRWHGQALQFAHRSGNREAVACTLVDMAMAHTDQGAGRAVVDLCGSALADSAPLGPEVAAFALQQQAHGASLLNNRELADASLDKAAALVDRVDEEQWGTAVRRTPGYVEVQRATCYGRLGLLEEADRLWREVIPAAPDTARRDVGVWTARHATVRARAQDPDHAVELAARAATVAAATGSARAVRELAAVERAMEPWKDAAAGRDLAEVLAPAKGM